MKLFFTLALLVVAAAAAPAAPDADATIVKFSSDNIGVEGYNYAVETSNGIQQQENAVLKNAGTENEAIEVRGSFGYIVDGVAYRVDYIANENGFQPTGAHLPSSV